MLFDERDLLLPDLLLLLERGLLDELPELDDEPLLFARGFVSDPLELDVFAGDDPPPDDDPEDDLADVDLCDEPCDDFACGADPLESLPFDVDPFDELDPS